MNNTFKIITAIVTLVIFSCCVTLSVLSAVLGQWMGAFICSLIASGFGYFVYRDYLTFVKK
jgi:hypothetical protein